MATGSATDFVTPPPTVDIVTDMAAKASASTATCTCTSTVGREVIASPELAAELIEAMAQIDRGEYIELTPEQLDHAVATGEWPWDEDESLD